MPSLPPDPAATPPVEVYHSLAAADLAEKARQVLGLLATHPQGRLELPAVNGLRAALDEIDLSRERLAREHQGGTHPRWWNAERQALDLRRSNLKGASLRHAHLQGALLEEIDLAGADLAGANLQGVDLSGANLQKTLLEGADLRKAVLRFCQGQGSVLEDAKLQGADLWGANMEGADLSGADLQGATLEEANLQGADLAEVDFRGAVLKRANLKGANLRGADLRGAVLGGAHLEDAVLRDARVEEVDLTSCTIAGVHTCGARLEKTRLEREQLGGAIGEEVRGEFGNAQKGYLALERNFEELGDHGAACWAYLRRRRMEKRQALRLAHEAWQALRWPAAIRSAGKYVGDQLVEWVCDYGESVWRVLATLLVVYVLFVPLYGVTGTVLRVEETQAGKVRTTTHDLMDLALFSLTAMTAPGNPPEDLVADGPFGYVVTGAQTLLALFLTGLMGFVAGNRIRR